MLRGRRSRVVKDAIFAAMALLMIGAAYTSVLIVQRQSALGAVSRYNLTWLVSQAGLEVNRLYGTIAASLIPGSGVDEDEVDLRLSIVENRIQLLQGGDIAAFIATSSDLRSIVELFRKTVRDARAELDAPPDPGHPVRLMRLVSTLNTPIARLAAAANAYSSDQEARDRRELNNLHWVFAAILAAITAFGLSLVAAMTWHNRLLERAQNEAIRHNLELKQRDTELQIRNHQFDAALNNMSQALCMTDADGHIIVCNTRFLDLFELGQDEVSPRKKASILFASADTSNPYRAMMVGGTVAKQERYAQDRTSVTFVEQDKAGFALAISQEPMTDGGCVSTFEDITERRRTEARIDYMAHHDTLTGLSNRGRFQARLDEALARRKVDGESVAVLSLDLDRFKPVNDMYGHPVGDELLRVVAARLTACVRKNDVVARLGGDEFAVLQAGADQPDAAQAAAARIVQELSQPYEIGGHHIVISTSVGVALAQEAAISAGSLLSNVDIALYRAKSDGKGLFRFYEMVMGHEVRERREMEADLREAVDRSDFNLFYQPLYDLASEQVCGFEALLRWQHPRKGAIPPSVFIPVAEEIGLIIAIGEWVLARACEDAASWPGNLKVAVNLSSVHLRGADLISAVRHTLRQSGLPACRLEIEITESALLQNSDTVLEVLGQLRALGLHLVLDDFGTGYSSLSYLHSFPFNKVKIDRSFVRDIVTEPHCAAIVRAVTDLASSLGMTTTAEGVETMEQLDRLRQMKCTEVQGFLFDQPMPVSMVSRWFPDRGAPPGSIPVSRAHRASSDRMESPVG